MRPVAGHGSPPEHETRNRRTRVGYVLLLVVAVGVILYFDTLNKSAEQIKPGLFSVNLQEEWFYLLLHAVSSAGLAWLIGRGLVLRRGTPGPRSLLAAAAALAFSFQLLSEAYQTATLPYHQPLPDFSADVLGIGIWLAAAMLSALR